MDAWFQKDILNVKQLLEIWIKNVFHQILCNLGSPGWISQFYLKEDFHIKRDSKIHVQALRISEAYYSEQILLQIRFLIHLFTQKYRSHPATHECKGRQFTLKHKSQTGRSKTYHSKSQIGNIYFRNRLECIHFLFFQRKFRLSNQHQNILDHFHMSIFQCKYSSYMVSMFGYTHQFCILYRHICMFYLTDAE